MNFKNKLLTIKLFNLLLILAALAASYFYYRTEYINFLDRKIESTVEQSKNGILDPLLASQKDFTAHKETFLNMHRDALQQYNANPDIDLETLKTSLLKQYTLPNLDVNVFLINPDMRVFDTTFKKDIGFDLSVFPETVKIINQAYENGEINLSELISRDPIDMKYKMYSYAKTNDGNILELGFMDSSAKIALFDAIHANKYPLSTTLYHVLEDGKNLFYFPVKENNTAATKEEIYSKQHRFSPTDPKRLTDPVMQVYLQKKHVIIENDDTYEVYASVYNPNNADIKTEYANIVVKFVLDNTEKNNFLSSIRTIFVLTALISSLVLFLLYHLIKREFERPFDLIKDNIQNSKKIPLNKLPNNHDEFHSISTAYNQLFDDLTTQVQKNKEMLLVDHLTQTQNRKAFDIKIQELINAHKRYERPFSMMLFDMDNFKKINDTLGHHIGDEILIDLSKLTQSIIRDCDFLYRIGGEEFIVLFPETRIDDAIIVSEKIRLAVENHFTDIRDLSVTISGGVCEAKSYDTQNTLFRFADELQYQAKAQGKNKICHELDDASTTGSDTDSGNVLPNSDLNNSSNLT